MNKNVVDSLSPNTYVSSQVSVLRVNQDRQEYHVLTKTDRNNTC